MSAHTISEYIPSEISMRGTVTNLAVARVASHVRRIDQVTQAVRERSAQLDNHLRELAETLHRLANACDKRFIEIEAGLQRITLLAEADNALQAEISRWQASTNYAGVHCPTRCCCSPGG
ncbi:MAG: hypothetical protein LC808_16585 [Actinobacteria bacterium]|nr:hypothetical protein [Actinomycetota bacterium]